MESLLLRLSSLFLLIIALPTFAYVPNYQMYPVNVNPALVSKFKAGYTAPYDTEYVRRVVVGKAKIMPNGAIINLPYGPDMVPSFHDLQNNPKWQTKKQTDYSISYWSEDEKRIIDILFWSAQVLDVYSTYRGLKYDCISEANPLLPEIPEIHEMIGIKLFVVGGITTLFEGDENFWYGWKLGAGITTGAVVANNFRLLRKAQRQCKKR